MGSTASLTVTNHKCDCGFESVDARSLIAHLRFGECVPRPEHGDVVNARLRVLAVDMEAARTHLGFLEHEVRALERLNATMWQRTAKKRERRLCNICKKETREMVGGVPQCASHVAKTVKGNAVVGVPAGDKAVARILEAFLYDER